ncbi:MAG: ABC transporter ATP-binding protein [Streblomastix strix]|uniref:ABC transporter ATP-binding protein n=1 Tax=Streblomastix strix TaxID=222440 RepID=A0A5J4X4R0_9EUKA|nr:MAG: ABC transporter ATP-binding protein [Streblomastix strix]
MTTDIKRGHRHGNKYDEDFIKLDGVHKTYLLGVEGIAALRGVDMTIKRGEFVMICGTSGGGKSTMLNIIGTIDKPTKGRVTLCGQQITPKTSDDDLARIRLENLGFVFQTFNLLSSMTALENVELPLTFKGLGVTHRNEVAKRLLESVQMGDRLDHFPSMLSGGEQQRVTIARSLANEPELLLLDEPTGDLDTMNTNNVMRILLDLNDKGITLIMVTHDMNLIPFATRVIFMRDGKIASTRALTSQERFDKITELNNSIKQGLDGNKRMDALDVGFKDGQQQEQRIQKEKRGKSGREQPGNESDDDFSSENDEKDPKSAKRQRKDRRISDLTDEQKQLQQIEEERQRRNKPVIPLVTAVREPGDYDPIFFADPEGMQAKGYQIHVDPNTLAVSSDTPLEDNPYSNLRIGTGNKKPYQQQTQQNTSREERERQKRGYQGLSMMLLGQSGLSQRRSSGYASAGTAASPQHQGSHNNSSNNNNNLLHTEIHNAITNPRQEPLDQMQMMLIINQIGPVILKGMAIAKGATTAAAAAVIIIIIIVAIVETAIRAIRTEVRINISRLQHRSLSILTWIMMIIEMGNQLWVIENTMVMMTSEYFCEFLIFVIYHGLNVQDIVCVFLILICNFYLNNFLFIINSCNYNSSLFCDY